MAPGLLEHLANSYGLQTVTVDDLAAYIAGVSAHPRFTQLFAEDLNSPGIHLPLTAEHDLWREGVRLGRRVIWASSFGERYVDVDDHRAAGRAGLRQAYPDIQYARGIAPTPLPESLIYDPASQELCVGAGMFTGVTERMRAYDVGGRSVLDHWLSARGSRPTGRVGSQLDGIRNRRWSPDWSTEFIEILNVLRHLTQLEPEQASLLDRVVSGTLIDVAELTRRGVLEPPAHTTGSRPPTGQDMLPGMDTVDGQEPAPVQQLPLPPSPSVPSSPPRSRRDAPRRATRSRTDRDHS
ncbi:type ISP restriction/modification enzyme [Streptacidiphilus sp. PAMC 29251]